MSFFSIVLTSESEIHFHIALWRKCFAIFITTSETDLFHLSLNEFVIKAKQFDFEFKFMFMLFYLAHHTVSNVSSNNFLLFTFEKKSI